MTTLTIQAADTASAMEEIADRLGEDALILSTTKKDGGHHARNKWRGPARSCCNRCCAVQPGRRI